MRRWKIGQRSKLLIRTYSFAFVVLRFLSLSFSTQNSAKKKQMKAKRKGTAKLRKLLIAEDDDDDDDADEERKSEIL